MAYTILDQATVFTCFWTQGGPSMDAHHSRDETCGHFRENALSIRKNACMPCKIEILSSKARSGWMVVTSAITSESGLRTSAAKYGTIDLRSCGSSADIDLVARHSKIAQLDMLDFAAL